MYELPVIVQQLQSQINEIKRSTSWRVTAPFRTISKSLASFFYIVGDGNRALRAAYAFLPIPDNIRLTIARHWTAVRRRAIGDRLATPAPGAWNVRAASPRPGEAPLDATSHDVAIEDRSLGRQAPDPRHAAYPGVMNAHDPVLAQYATQVLSLSQQRTIISQTYVPKIIEKPNLEGAPLKIVAFYLPQFHPFAENDEWWGKGFTEWTNVSKGVPQFVGHYQPHLPGELGFYDLRLVDVMRQQVNLARLYGIGGFCFHHYWFGGKRLMRTPVDQFLAARDIDFPFCLCWANENWTRRWDGQESDVLIAQEHSDDDDIAFIDHIMPMLKDERYIRVQGKPVLIVYRASILPDAKATARRWRERCIAAGLKGLYLIAARSFEVRDPRPYDFDAAVEFPPHQVSIPQVNSKMQIVNPDYQGRIYGYDDLARGFAAQPEETYPLIRTIVPGWDNEARKPGAGDTFHGSTPALYGAWLRDAYRQTVAESNRQPEDHPALLFINAWNEWAEGAHLEPDRKYGYAYLHATANVIRDFLPENPDVNRFISISQSNFRKTSNIAIVMHLYYDSLAVDFHELTSPLENCDIFISLRPDIDLFSFQRVTELFPHAYFFTCANRGRDVLPFLRLLRVLRRMGYEHVCKVHTKRSPHRIDGDQLRRNATRHLIGSPSRVDKIVRLLGQQADVGIIGPKGSMLSLTNDNYAINNRSHIDNLLIRLDRLDHVGRHDWNFVAGTMFWARLEALFPIDDLDIQPAEFEDELGQVDGTLAHALERIFTLSAEIAGFRSIEV